MTATYTQEFLQSILGEPTWQGHMPGDGSYGYIVTSGTSERSHQVPLGPNRYMTWKCPGAGDDGPYCKAISVAAEGELIDQWFVVSTCERHKGDFELSPFPGKRLFPHPPNFERPEPRHEVVVIDRESYETETGPDWERLQALLERGYEMAARGVDYRMQEFIIIVLEKSSIR